MEPQCALPLHLGTPRIHQQQDEVLCQGAQNPPQTEATHSTMMNRNHQEGGEPLGAESSTAITALLARPALARPKELWMLYLALPNRPKQEEAPNQNSRTKPGEPSSEDAARGNGSTSDLSKRCVAPAGCNRRSFPPRQHAESKPQVLLDFRIPLAHIVAAKSPDPWLFAPY
jgi:hypothetical protein